MQGSKGTAVAEAGFSMDKAVQVTFAIYKELLP